MLATFDNPASDRLGTEIFSWFWNYGNVANLASILGLMISVLGLIITARTYKKLTAIEQNYLFQARVPKLIKKIENHGSAISRLLSNFKENKEKIKTELSKCLANLQNIDGKLNAKEKIPISKLIEYMSTQHQQGYNEDSVWKTYTDLQHVIEFLVNLREDRQWSSRDAG